MEVVEKMEAKSIIGQRLRSLRKKQNLSQEEMARLCRMSVRTYGKIERGEANFEIDTLTKIMDVLKIDFGVFDGGMKAASQEQEGHR